MSEQIFNEGAVFVLRRIDFVDKVRRTLDLALSLVLLLVLDGPDGPDRRGGQDGQRRTGPLRQRRVGRDGRVFTIFKFRTMKPNCDDGRLRDLIARELNGEDTSEGGSFKLSDDTRVTRIGGFLRRTSLDELPQIRNCASGNMSLVGPRPCLEWEAAMFLLESRSRFTVRPGITGLWQVSGRSELGTLDMLKLDLQYVRHRTLWMDFIILLRTVPTLLRASGLTAPALLLATTGGHLTQLAGIAERIPHDPDSVWVTHANEQSESMLADRDVQFIPYVGVRDVRGVLGCVPVAHALHRRRRITRAISTGSGIAIGFLPYLAARAWSATSSRVRRVSSARR